MTMSAPLMASAISATLRPPFFALAHEAPALPQRHRDLDARLLQVLRVRMALRAVADDRDLLALDERKVASLS